MGDPRKQLLADKVVAHLTQAIRDGTYGVGGRLPSELMLSQEHGVSRATVRTALKELDVLGLVTTRHGIGTFVNSRTPITDGLERIGSISASIRASGKTPSNDYARRALREATPDEAERMDITVGTEVLELRRRILADSQAVAYSYDVIPRSVLPATFKADQIRDSIFEYFAESAGLYPAFSIAHVHAVESPRIAWGVDAPHHRLFVLLDQLEYTATNMLLIYSRTYFVEGAYSFNLVRRNL